MNKTLYVTSFNKKLFDVTGKDMVNSFLSTGMQGDLLVTYEDDIAEQIPKADNITLLKLESYEFLNNWLENNKDIIPVEYGAKWKVVIAINFQLTNTTTKTIYEDVLI